MIKCKIDWRKRIKMKVSGTPLDLSKDVGIIIDGVIRAIRDQDPESEDLFKYTLIRFITDPDSPLNKKEEAPHEEE